MTKKDDVLQGIEHYQKGRLYKAERFFKRALETDPENFAAINNLALVLAERGKKKEAISLLKKTMKKCERDSGYYASLRKNLARINKLKVARLDDEEDREEDFDD